MFSHFVSLQEVWGAPSATAPNKVRASLSPYELSQCMFGRLSPYVGGRVQPFLITSEARVASLCFAGVFIHLNFHIMLSCDHRLQYICLGFYVTDRCKVGNSYDSEGKIMLLFFKTCHKEKESVGATCFHFIQGLWPLNKVHVN